MRGTQLSSLPLSLSLPLSRSLSPPNSLQVTSSYQLLSPLINKKKENDKNNNENKLNTNYNSKNNLNKNTNSNNNSTDNIRNKINIKNKEIEKDNNNSSSEDTAHTHTHVHGQTDKHLLEMLKLSSVRFHVGEHSYGKEHSSSTSSVGENMNTETEIKYGNEINTDFIHGENFNNDNFHSNYNYSGSDYGSMLELFDNNSSEDSSLKRMFPEEHSKSSEYLLIDSNNLELKVQGLVDEQRRVVRREGCEMKVRVEMRGRRLVDISSAYWQCQSATDIQRVVRGFISRLKGQHRKEKGE